MMLSRRRSPICGPLPWATTQPRTCRGGEFRMRRKRPECSHEADLDSIYVSLKTVSRLLDASRSSARRWLNEAGVRPFSVGRGRNGAVRYRGRDVRLWLESLRQVD